MGFPTLFKWSQRFFQFVICDTIIVSDMLSQWVLFSRVTDAKNNLKSHLISYSSMKDLFNCLIAHLELNVMSICRSNFEMFALSQALFPK